MSVRETFLGLFNVRLRGNEYFGNVHRSVLKTPGKHAGLYIHTYVYIQNTSASISAIYSVAFKTLTFVLFCFVFGGGTYIW